MSAFLIRRKHLDRPSNSELAGERRKRIRRPAECHAKPPVDRLIVWNDGPVPLVRDVLIQRRGLFQEAGNGSEREEPEAGGSLSNLLSRKHLESVMDTTVHHQSVDQQESCERSVPFARVGAAGLERGTIPNAGFYGQIHLSRPRGAALASYASITRGPAPCPRLSQLRNGCARST